MALTCPLCGTENEAGRDTCAACGARLSPAVGRPAGSDGAPAAGSPVKPASTPGAPPGEVRLRDPVDDPWFAEDAPAGVSGPASPVSRPEPAVDSGPVAAVGERSIREEAPAPEGEAPGAEEQGVEAGEASTGEEAGTSYAGWPPAWQSPYGQQQPGPAQYPYPWNPWAYGAQGAWPYAPQPFMTPYPAYPGYPPPQPFYGYPPPCPYMGWYGYGQPLPVYPAPYAPAAYQSPAYGSPYPAPYPDAYAGYTQRPAAGSRKKASAGLVIGIIILLLAIAGGVTAAFLLTSSGKASFNLGDGAVTGADIEFRGVTLEQDGSNLTLSGTYDNNSKREGDVTATVQALTGGAEQLIAFEIPVEPGTGTRFSKTKAESVKLNGATLGPLLFSGSTGSFYDDTEDEDSDTGTTTPSTSPKSSPVEEDEDSSGTTPGSTGTTTPGSTGTTYPGYPGTFPGYPYDQL